jgi:hypothetical protein
LSTIHCLASRSNTPGNALSKCQTAVDVSGASVLVTSAAWGRKRAPTFGSFARSTEKLTSSAVTSRPAENLTPGRIFSITLLPSSLSFHDSARLGCGLISAS